MNPVVLWYETAPMIMRITNARANPAAILAPTDLFISFVLMSCCSAFSGPLTPTILGGRACAHRKAAWLHPKRPCVQRQHLSGTPLEFRSESATEVAKR